MANTTVTEAIIEPELPIVDAHHHLWFMTSEVLEAVGKRDDILARGLAPILRRHARYLFDELLTDLNSGHNIRATVYVDAGAMYRASGSEQMKSVGEVEFANGVAAVAASGAFGDVKACAGIVGNVDLRLGSALEKILGAHIQAGGERYRGVRCGALTAYDSDARILGLGIPRLLLDEQFRAGFKWLQIFGLSFDVFVLEPQLPELIDLARTFPGVSIILNHAGTPLVVGRHAGQREERFPIWRENMRALSRCANVTVKLGGLGLPFAGFKTFMANPPATSEELACEWRPYIETCIEVFGVNRCMFESNYPVDAATCTYPVLWNAFKRLTAGASPEEKTALFSGTATRVYRLEN